MGQWSLQLSVVTTTQHEITLRFRLKLRYISLFVSWWLLYWSLSHSYYTISVKNWVDIATTVAEYINIDFYISILFLDGFHTSSFEFAYSDTRLVQYMFSG